MNNDPDFHLVYLKVNAAGSWANAGRFETIDYEEVKAHCLALASLANMNLKFKIVDAAGGTLEHLRTCNGLLDWYKA